MRNEQKNRNESFLSKYKSLIILNTLLLLAVAIWGQIKPVDHLREYVIDRKESNIYKDQAIYGSKKISQTFQCSRGLDSIEAYIIDTNSKYHGAFSAKLYDESGKELKTWKVDKLDLVSGKQGEKGWIFFYFGDINPVDGKRYRFELSAYTLDKLNAITVRTCDSIQEDIGICDIDGEEITGQVLEFAAYKKHINWFFVSAVTILFLLANIWWFNREKSVDKQALLILFGTGMIMFLIMTPKSQPDEIYHFNSSAKLSNIMIGKNGNINSIEEELFADFQENRNANDSYVKILTRLFDKTEYSGNEKELDYKDDLNHPLVYLAPAFGITVVRLLHGNCVQAYELARFFTLLSYVAMAWVAIRLIPIRKDLLLLICIIPMAMHQAVSTSRDVFVNGMSLVYFAYYVKIIYEKKPFTWGRVIFSAVMLSLFGPVKVVYCILALLVLLIPKAQFRNRLDQICKTASILIGIFAVLIIIEWSHMRNELISSTYSGKTDYYHIDFLYKYPVRFATLIINSIEQSFWKFTKGAVGTNMAGWTVSINEYLSVAYLMILAISTVRVEELDYSFGRWQKTGMISISVMGYILLTCAFAFANSIYGDILVSGVQGRYLIPFVAPLLYGMSTKKIRAYFNEHQLMYAVWFAELGYIVEIMNQIYIA